MKWIICLVLLLSIVGHAQIAQWIHRYPGYGPSGAYDIAVDNAGNVYVAGWGAYPSRSADFLIIKYNDAGDTLWVRYYDGGANFYDYATALAVDDSGNVYVTGRSIASGSDYDIATMKYNSAGVEQWVTRYNGPANSDDEGNDIVLDDAGNVYVTGVASATPGAHYITIKHESTGDTAWTALYGGPDGMGCVANALALDASGNVYVTGNGFSLSTADDFATVKYNSQGDEEWVATYNGLTTYADDTAYDIEVVSGYIYVTGASDNASFNPDCFTIKYNSAGDTLWTARYDGPGNAYDRGYALDVDDSGNVFVTGVSFDTYTQSDYMTIKYNSSGLMDWEARYNGPDSAGDQASAIVRDSQGNIYVTGRSYAYGTYTPEYDYLTVKYNSSGVEQWNARYDGTGHTQDYAHAIAVDNAGYVYITGESIGNTSYEDVVTIKYTTTGVKEDAGYTAQKAGFNLTASPNPFHHSTKIKYSILNTGCVEEELRNANFEMRKHTLKIYDAAGRLVKDFFLPTTYYLLPTAVSWDGTDQSNCQLGSGVYFLRLEVGDYHEMQQLLLVR